jgi:hypothetical protein
MMDKDFAVQVNGGKFFRGEKGKDFAEVLRDLVLDNTVKKGDKINKVGCNGGTSYLTFDEYRKITRVYRNILMPLVDANLLKDFAVQEDANMIAMYIDENEELEDDQKIDVCQSIQDLSELDVNKYLNELYMIAVNSEGTNMGIIAHMTQRYIDEGNEVAKTNFKNAMCDVFGRSYHNHKPTPTEQRKFLHMAEKLFLELQIANVEKKYYRWLIEQGELCSLDFIDEAARKLDEVHCEDSALICDLHDIHKISRESDCHFVFGEYKRLYNAKNKKENKQADKLETQVCNAVGIIRNDGRNIAWESVDDMHYLFAYWADEAGAVSFRDDICDKLHAIGTDEALLAETDLFNYDADTVHDCYREIMQDGNPKACFDSCNEYTCPHKSIRDCVDNADDFSPEDCDDCSALNLDCQVCKAIRNMYNVNLKEEESE